VTISRRILSVLATQPDGAMAVSALTSRLVRETADRQQFEEHLRRSKLTGVFEFPIMRAEGASAIFSKGLVDRPQRGVWRITTLGREYLSLIRQDRSS